MPFVIFNLETKEIRSAGYWTEESVFNELTEGFGIGLVEDIQFKGAISNFEFVPDTSINNSDKHFISGYVVKKEKIDLEAEKTWKETSARFRKLHYMSFKEIDSIEILTLSMNKFSLLFNDENETSKYSFPIKNLQHPITITRHKNQIQWSHEYGGFEGETYQFIQTRMELNHKDDFVKRTLRNAVQEEVGNTDPDIYTSSIIKRECLKFLLKNLNLIINSYRIAFNDGIERTVGIADIIDAVLNIKLKDNTQGTFHTGLVNKLFRPNLFKQKDTRADNLSKMETFIEREYLPFLESSLCELEKAFQLGQSYECIIWSAVIISTVIDNLMKKYLSTDRFKEYEKIKGNEEVKRKEWFKEISGQTLCSFLETITANYSFNKETEWKNLYQNITKIYARRNDLIHNQKLPSDDLDFHITAYKTTKHFISAINHRVPHQENTHREC